MLQSTGFSIVSQARSFDTVTSVWHCAQAVFPCAPSAIASVSTNNETTSPSRKVMIESIFATGVPFMNSPNLPRLLAELARLMPRCAGVRRFGAASLDLAYVAAGTYNPFIYFRF